MVPLEKVKVKFFATEKEYFADEIGALKLDQEPRKEIKAGDVGYIISGIKIANEVKVGDTINVAFNPDKCHVFNANKEVI